jgi:integrase/recombinase XerD
MLSTLFPRSATKYQRSQFGREVSDFCDWLIQTGYSKDNIRGHLRRLFRVLTHSRKLDAGAIRSTAPVHQAFGRYCTSVEASQHFRGTEHAYMRFLRDQSRLHDQPAPMNATSVLIQKYQRYLADVRGLSASTLHNHVQTVQEFVKTALSAGQHIRSIKSKHIENYLARKSKRIRRQTMQHVVAHLRAFLRYAGSIGVLKPDLAIIDTPRTYRAELPPRAMPWDLVTKLLDSVDRPSKAGWRDYAILHLMAYYGLRASEIADLRLDSINWDRKTCHVQQRKTASSLVLPLSKKTLSIIRRYLRHGRPASSLPHLFLRARRPEGRLHHCAVCDIFYKRAAQSKLGLDAYSSYSLRHSFAMRLLERGVGVKAIGDLLGHRSLEATCVYLRLDMSALRSVALPLPKETHHAA